MSNIEDDSHRVLAARRKGSKRSCICFSCPALNFVKVLRRVLYCLVTVVVAQPKQPRGSQNRNVAIRAAPSSSLVGNLLLCDPDSTATIRSQNGSASASREQTALEKSRSPWSGPRSNRAVLLQLFSMFPYCCQLKLHPGAYGPSE